MKRIETLLALIMLNQVRGASLATQAYYLNMAGFTDVEIANILELRAAEIHGLVTTAEKQRPSNRVRLRKK